MVSVPPELLNVTLPVGFELKEDGDCVHLHYQDIQVATFSALGVNPKEIVETARRFARSLEGK